MVEEGVTRETSDYTRLGVAASEAFADGPATFVDFVRTTLSIAAHVHAMQTATSGDQPQLLDSFIPLSKTRH
jgi:hypothetical protein